MDAGLGEWAGSRYGSWMPAEVRRHGRAARGGGGGERNAERGADANDALGRQGTAVRLHDSVADAEAESRSGAFGLGREKGLEDALLYVRGHAGASVPDLDDDPASFVTCGDAELANGSARHRVLGVHDEIQEHLLKLPVITAHRRERRIESGLEHDAGGSHPVRAQPEG